MALATYQHTRIDDLNDLLRYLTEDLGYTKGVAVYMANQRYKDGDLRLTKVEYVGIKPQGEIPIAAEFGHIEVHRGRMRFVPREPLWRKAIYRIAEGCDVRAIWPALSAPIASTPMAALSPRAAKGPVRGEIDRFGDADRALFPEIERLMKLKQLSVTEAVRIIANEHKLAGRGTLDSRIRRVSDRFRREKL
jgi:hypothetical protein